MEQAATLTASLLAAEEGSGPTAVVPGETCLKGKQTTSHDGRSASAGSRCSGDVASHKDQLLCMYEDLTDYQAKQLLIYHGQKGSFLFVKQTGGLAVHIRLGEDWTPMYSKHTIMRDSGGYTLEGSCTVYRTTHDLIQCLVQQYSSQGVTLSPLFAPSENLFSASPSTSFSVPPEYSAAQRYPNAPTRDLPAIRMISHFTHLHTNVTNSLRYPTPSASDHFSISSIYAADNSPGCLRTACHRHCYLAQDGRWWNPCKAAPAMCVLLTIVWVSIFVLFGWIALLLALVLGAVLTVTVVCAFIQTGHCYCKAVYCCEGPLEHVETSGVQ